MGTLFISPAQLALLPTTGAAWDNIVTHANGTDASDMANQDSLAAIQTFAAAIMYARNGTGPGRTAVIDRIKAACKRGPLDSLGIYRQWALWVIAADLVDMAKETLLPIGVTLAAYCEEIKTSSWGDHSKYNSLDNGILAPHNYGAYARGSAAANAVFTGDTARLQTVYDIQARWLGDLSLPNPFANPTVEGKTAGWFSATGFDTSAAAHYLAVQGVINPAGDTVKQGVNCEDAARGGGPPTIKGNGISYSLGAADGTAMAMVVLSRHGFPQIWASGGSGLRRNIERLLVDAPYASWPYPEWHRGMTHLINHVYGTALPELPVTRARHIAFMDWFTASTAATAWLKDDGSGGGGAVIGPTAALTLSLVSGSTLHADVAGTTAGTNPISHHLIDWGDGSVSQIDEPTRTIDHTYATSGVKTITATAVDTTGLTSSITKTFSTTSDQPPVAVFSVTPKVGVAPLTVTYDTAGSSDPDGTAITRRIDWGDGTIDNAAPATGSHTYAEQSKYPTTMTASLVVTSSSVDSAPALQRVTLNDPDVPLEAQGYVLLESGQWARLGARTPLFAHKRADQSQTNNGPSGIVTDDALKLQVEAGQVYIVDAMLVFSGDPTGDVEVGFTAPAGSTLDWNGPSVPNSGVSNVSGAGNMRWCDLAATQRVGAAGAGIKVTAFLSGLLVAGQDGEFALRWAQGAANAVASVMHAGSWMRCAHTR